MAEAKIDLRPGEEHLSLAFAPMDEDTARAILDWQYDAPYDIYNEVEDALPALLDPANAYYRIDNEHGDLVAYCCFGPDARVAGGGYSADALDIGFGLRPDLTGRGHGEGYVSTLVRFARKTFRPDRLRVTVAAFNRRALRVWEKSGFVPVQAFARKPDGLAFVILECQA
jgi:[ribosomal protein S18]-alanine N-acetyltransferase